MNEIKKLEIRIFIAAAVISGALALPALLLKGSAPCFGILAGLFIGIFYFKMIVLSAKSKTCREEVFAAGIISRFGCFFRFLLLGILFWLAAERGLAFFVGTGAGFLSIKAAIFFEGIRGKFSCKA
ncbi:MAG: hypothetical protein KAU12_01070 [Candidatus Omnitrophica bacterium]|nr:hypothetical protein [Candidatus Omnitrophota bacterium]